MLKRVIVLVFLTIMVARPIFFIGTVGYYSLHIDEIIEKYCVNKDAPELQCNGQCHLAKQLKVSQTQEKDVPYNLSEVSLVFPVVYFESSSNIDLLYLQDQKTQILEFYQNYYGFDYFKNIEIPPEA